LFSHINKPEIKVEEIQNTFSIGSSVLLDADIGLGMGQQRIFLGQFNIVARALNPPPLCILVKGAVDNRGGVGNGTDNYGVLAEDMEQMADKESKHLLQVSRINILNTYCDLLSI